MDRFEWLSHQKPNHFILEYAPNAPMYEKPEQWLQDNEDRDFAEVLPGEKEKILATGSIWVLQVYPDTPIGFWVIAGSTLASVIDHWMASEAEECPDCGKVKCNINH